MTPDTAAPEELGRDIVVEQLVWRGITLSVSYEADWLGSGECGSKFATAHLQIEAISPERSPLPMTETGYRSHFLAQGIVEEAGGAAAYALAWLEHATKSPNWRQKEITGRQLSLF